MLQSELNNNLKALADRYEFSTLPTRRIVDVNLNPDGLDALFGACFDVLLTRFRPIISTSGFTREQWISVNRLLTSRRIQFVRAKVYGVRDQGVTWLNIDKVTPVFGPIFVTLAHIGEVYSSNLGIRFVPGLAALPKKEWFTMDEALLRQYNLLMGALRDRVIVSDGMPSGHEGSMAYLLYVDIGENGATAHSPTGESTPSDSLLASVVFQTRAIASLSYDWLSRPVQSPDSVVIDLISGYIRGGVTWE